MLAFGQCVPGLKNFELKKKVGNTVKRKEISSQLEMAVIHQPALVLLAQAYVAKCMYKYVKYSLAYLQNLISTLAGIK